jgi:predicted DNA repair protein MutK
MALKAVRDEKPVPSLSYGQGVGAGALISLMSSAMSAVYTFIHLKWINTSFADYKLDQLRTQWAAKGMSDTAIERAEAMTRGMMTPAWSACFAFVFGFIFGLIICLIVAAIVKRPAPAGSEPPPM